MTNWKTTVEGILAFLITTMTTLSGFLVAGNLVSATNPGAASIHVSTWIVVGVNVALALCRAWVGLLQKDADKLQVVNPSTGTALPVTSVPTKGAS